VQYVAYEQSKSIANIVVDGSANACTELVLSHWQNSASPDDLRADLSAEIVFNYLARPDLHVSAQATTNNHFDADGLVGIYTLINPLEAAEMRGLLIDIAGAGDFDVYQDRDAARVSFVLDAWTQPANSPLNKNVFAQDYPSVANVLYEELLPRFSKIIEKIDSLEHFWIAQDEHLDASEEAFSKGRFKLKEIAQNDLAIVTMPDSNTTPANAVHRMAIHNQTNCMRILLMQENNYELYFRYETWVQYHSRVLTQRKDLKPLAEKLTKQESMDGVWSFGGINDLTPALKLTGAPLSKIPFDSFKSQVLEFLTEE
jgi:hypothetical protein